MSIQELRNQIARLKIQIERQASQTEIVQLISDIFQEWKSSPESFQTEEGMALKKELEELRLKIQTTLPPEGIFGIPQGINALFKAEPENFEKFLNWTKE